MFRCWSFTTVKENYVERKMSNKYYFTIDSISIQKNVSINLLLCVLYYHDEITL